MKITDKFAHFETEKEITEISGNIYIFYPILYPIYISYRVKLNVSWKNFDLIYVLIYAASRDEYPHNNENLPE